MVRYYGSVDIGGVLWRYYIRMAGQMCSLILGFTIWNDRLVGPQLKNEG